MKSRYEHVNTNEVAKQQTHLTAPQQSDLAKVLGKFQELFSGKLLTYPHQKVHLKLKKEAEPFHFCPYAVPEVHKKVFKEELERLVEIGVLSPHGPSEFHSSTFIIPKKDGRVRSVSDF